MDKIYYTHIKSEGQNEAGPLQLFLRSSFFTFYFQSAPGRTVLKNKNSGAFSWPRRKRRSKIKIFRAFLNNQQEHESTVAHEKKKKKYRRGFLSCMFFILFSAKKERKKNGDDECARRKIHGLRKRRRMENSLFPNVSQGRVSVGNGENSVDFQGKVAIREDV